ncbi:SDR family NAD(P)-dependent oxidoreductase [Sphingobacterium faecium]|uniref:SDR family NAD(P)-dependent oxidoreductase n=1 Tax=Sphingobacterium faecium TaxID=34087 RepID=UPI002469AD7B|nr:SDR family NAD(P)-dependent oxidoreductase [Sphingobacterium faecium]MDH5825979.1 SDR family NAD(P)-dependent oxidoreductase [Sphingobacterium faecium]
MNTNKVWFITGASKGLGLALVKKLLANNYRVAATSRTISALRQNIPSFSDSFLPLEMDITNDENVKASIEKVIAHYGQIDVIVNNAGYSQIGTQEELSDKEVKQNFDVNVFGLLNVIRHSTPYLRKQRFGHVFNISSIGGFVANSLDLVFIAPRNLPLPVLVNLSPKN